MPQIILKERPVHLDSYTFLQEMLINIKTCHFHSYMSLSLSNYQEKLFHSTLVTGYSRLVHIEQFLRTNFLIEHLQNQSFADILQNRFS